MFDKKANPQLEREKNNLVDKDGKLVDNDIGFLMETLKLCQNLVTLETHSFDSFCSTNKELFLTTGKVVREMRTKYLKMIAKGNDGQVWCMSKHICEILIRLQELTTRAMSVGDIDMAKDMAKDSQVFIEMFLQLNGYSSENISLDKTEA